MSTRAWLTWIGLLALLAAATWASACERERASSIERVVPREALAGRIIAALTIDEPGDGPSYFYAQSKGLWRSREAFGAPADEERVHSLLAALVDATGRVVDIAPGGESAYGFDSAELTRIRLHGKKVLTAPDEDVVLDFELGAASGGRAFVRERSRATIFELDRDPRTLFTPASELPPMLDTRLLAGTIRASFRGFERIFVDFEDGTSFEVVAEPGASDTEQQWTVVHDGERTPALVWRIGGYTNFLVRETWRGLASPKQAPGLGLAPPRATVTLKPNEGEIVELFVSAPDAAKRCYVWNKLTNVVLMIDGDLFPYLAPQRSWFTDASIANPWERWIAR